MATVILVRHGRTTANVTGMLAGRLPGVRLDETGTAQADRTGERLAAVRLASIVTSPLERCRQTARAWVSRSGSPSGPGNTAADGWACTIFHSGSLTSSLIGRPVQSP